MEQFRLFLLQVCEFVNTIPSDFTPRKMQKCSICGKMIDVNYNGYATKIGRVCDRCYDGCLLEYERKVRKLFKAGFFK